MLRSITFWRFLRVLKTFVFILFGRELTSKEQRQSYSVHGRVQNTAARDFTEHHRTTQNPSIRTFVEYLSFYRLYSRIIACLLNDTKITHAHQAPDLFTVFQNHQNVSLELSRFGIAVLDLKSIFSLILSFKIQSLKELLTLWLQRQKSS